MKCVLVTTNSQTNPPTHLVPTNICFIFILQPNLEGGRR